MDTLNQLSDEQLVSRYAMGQNEAFDVLLNRYKRKVFSYILLSVKDYDVANDVFQDTFIKVISTIKSSNYQEKGKFSGWVLRIAHNLVIDYYRRQASVNVVSGDSSDDDEPGLFDSLQIVDKSFEDDMLEGQLYTDLTSLVALLPENQKEVVSMRFFQDMSFKEIADATGVSINTALGRMRYAMINLRKLAELHNVSLD